MNNDKLSSKMEKTLAKAKKFSPSNRSVFSKGIYFEGLRQGKMVGFIYAGLMAIISILVVVGGTVAALFQEDATMSSLPPDSGLGIAAYMAFMVIIPALMFVLFHFLSTRKGSDHFCSLPVTRTAILVSYTLSAFTWVIIGLLVFIVPIIGVNLFAVGSVYFAGWMALLGAVLIACLLVAAAMLIAVSVASNIFGQIAVTLMVLFLPRVLITFGYSLAQFYTGILFPIERTTGFLEPATNILTGIIFAPFGLGNFYQIPSVLSALYTLGLAILYLAIALVLFRRRPSEAAEEPASSGLAQNIISALVAFVVALIPLVLLINLISEKQRYGSYDIGLVIGVAALYALSLIVFFAYRAISAKSLSAVRRPWGGLAIFLVLNVAFLGIWWLSVSAVYGFNPTAAEIRYFKGDISEAAAQAFDVEANQYSQHLLSQYEIDDDIMDAQLIAAIRRNAQDAKEGNLYNDPQNINRLNVTMKVGARTVNRVVFLSNEEYAIIVERLHSGHPQVKDLALSWPDPATTSRISSQHISNEKDLLELATTLFAELKEQGRAHNEFGSSVYCEPLDALYIEGKVNGQSYWINGLIIDETTPKTAELFLSMLAKKLPNSLDEVIAQLQAEKFGRMELHPIIAGRDSELASGIMQYGSQYIAADLGTYYGTPDYVTPKIPFLQSDYNETELALELARENWGRAPELGKSVIIVSYGLGDKYVTLMFGLDENGAAFKKYAEATKDWWEFLDEERSSYEIDWVG
ncbi:MAG: ABC transporter permease [Oscillospiraceae bacterium]|jgi:hypothetical protein|nr:ABC transporter permease [Oscillospiraceae bacterium]